MSENQVRSAGIKTSTVSRPLRTILYLFVCVCVYARQGCISAHVPPVPALLTSCQAHDSYKKSIIIIEGKILHSLYTVNVPRKGAGGMMYCMASSAGSSVRRSWIEEAIKNDRKQKSLQVLLRDAFHGWLAHRVELAGGRWWNKKRKVYNLAPETLSYGCVHKRKKTGWAGFCGIIQLWKATFKINNGRKLLKNWMIG